MKPFLILCDVNMPMMGGIELRTAISKDPVLKSESIPFVFFTTSATSYAIEKAYEMDVQGFFEKANSVSELAKTLRTIIEYWKLCKHPNPRVEKMTEPCHCHRLETTMQSSLHLATVFKGDK